MLEILLSRCAKYIVSGMPKTKATVEQCFMVLDPWQRSLDICFRLCRCLVNYSRQSQSINGRIMRWRYFGEDVKAVTMDEFLTALTATVRMLIQNCDYSMMLLNACWKQRLLLTCLLILGKKSKMRFLQI